MRCRLRDVLCFATPISNPTVSVYLPLTGRTTEALLFHSISSTCRVKRLSSRRTPAHTPDTAETQGEYLPGYRASSLRSRPQSPPHLRPPMADDTPTPRYPVQL